jgi:multiple antibiotic resistance protein
MATSFIETVNTFVKFFFLLTPFFGLSMFLAMTRELPESERKRLALRVAVAVWIVCFVFFLSGKYLFQVFGITLDAFRIGTGTLLFITAIGLAQGKEAEVDAAEKNDFVVVPLAVPIIAGPATLGTLLVISAETPSWTSRAFAFVTLSFAIVAMGTLLYLAASLERLLSKRGILILSKLTGLVLSALAAQMIFTGVADFIR